MSIFTKFYIGEGVSAGVALGIPASKLASSPSKSSGGVV
jgi:hypothetical protein